MTQKQILTIAADCELSSTHPIGTSIVSAAREKNLELSSPKEAEEISGKGIRAVFPEGTVLCGSKGLLENTEWMSANISRTCMAQKCW